MRVDKPFDYTEYLEIEKGEEKDFLFEPLFHIISMIESLAEDTNEGILVSIVGAWGCGKTSVLRALESYFKDYKGFPTIFHTAWKYQEDPHPLVPLFIKLQNLTKERKLKEKITNFIKKFIGGGLLIGSDILVRELTHWKLSSGAIKGMKEIKEIMDIISLLEELTIKNHSIFEENFKELENLIEEIAKKHKKQNNNIGENWKKLLTENKLNFNKEKKFVVIIVDDLDRLIPEKGFSLLEMLRFYLNIPNTIIIMGLDDKILSKYIEDHYGLERGIFKGGVFMEKIFQWSYALHSIGFNPVMQKFHFSDVLKKAGISELPQEIVELFSTIDPLPHRKWNRIANRLEARIIKNSDILPEDAFISIIDECFPDAEVYLRKFPELKKIFWSDNIPDELKPIYNECLEIIKKDDSHFIHPYESFNKINEKIKEIIKAEVT